MSTDDNRTTALLARSDEIETKLDPTARRRGRIIADTVTIVVLAPLSVALDWHVTRPFLMLGLMVAGLGVNRLIPLVSEWRLRREHDRLLAGADRGDAEVDAGTV